MRIIHPFDDFLKYVFAGARYALEEGSPQARLEGLRAAMSICYVPQNMSLVRNVTGASKNGSKHT